MGLINWFKDKVIQKLEHDVALLGAQIARIDMVLEQMQSQIVSVRQARYKKQIQEEETPTREQDLQEIIKAFGGLPIELAEKYKNNGMQ